ncbi:MAG: cytochrome c [Nitrospinota bacterium]|nr:MAG: cytochrome c [Nitrospinota bacterium]
MGWPWNQDMVDQPSLKPQERPLSPPPNTVPVQGKAPQMNRLEAAEKLRNPVPPTPESLERGKRLFAIYCALCHGKDARGNGPVAKKFVPPPNLTLELFKQRTDGYLYGTITNGGALMPSQAENLSPTERWDVVNYLRSLQGP